MSQNTYHAIGKNTTDEIVYKSANIEACICLLTSYSHGQNVWDKL